MGLPVAHGQQIVVDGRTATNLAVSGAVTNITTSTIVGNNAFNSFSKFDVNAGNTVNLHVPSGASNLLNLVSSASASRIDGMLNAVKNGQIGGNVFLANPEGVIVGTSGVINVGSLTLLTPTHAFVDNFFQAGVPDAASVNSMLQGTVPINAAGLIRVQGKINAAGDVALLGGNVTVDGLIQSGALFTGTQVDFSDIVNTTDIQAGSAVIVQNGRIQIVAANDVVITGTVATDGQAGINAGTIEIGAGHDATLAAGSLLSARGRGGDTSGGVVNAYAGNALSTAGTVRVDSGTSGRGGEISMRADGELAYLGGLFSATSNSLLPGTISLSANDLSIDGDLLRGTNWDAMTLNLAADNLFTLGANRILSTRQVAVNANQAARDAHISNSSTGDSLDISISARRIVLESGSQILAQGSSGHASGDITLSAVDTATDLFFKSLDDQEAAIEIHGATLKGNNITLGAVADDVFEYTGDDTANMILKQLDDIAYLADVSISEARARVTLDQNATIVAGNNVNIHASANAQASMNVTGALGFGLGYGKATASATADIAGATITAGNDVSISTESTAATDISVATINRGRDNPLGVNSSKYIDLAIALSEGDLDSAASVGSASAIDAGGALSVKALGRKTAKVSASGGAYDDGTAGAGIAFSSFDSDISAHLDGSVVRADSITVQADLVSPDATNTISASSGAGTGSLTNVKQVLPSQLVSSALSIVQSKIFGLLGSKPQSPTSSEQFGLSAAFLYLDHDNDVEARIGPNARIRMDGALNVAANSEDVLTYRAASSVDQSKVGGNTSAKEKALAASVAVVDLTNDTRAYIGDNAVVDAGGAITVAAHSAVPAPYEQWADWSGVDGFWSGADKLENLLGSATLSLVTGWSQSFAESEKLGLAGSFNFFTLGNHADAWIGDGARINTGPGFNAVSNAPDVTVSALASQGTINFAGVFGFKFFGVKSENTGVGGSLVSLDFSDRATARIGRGAIVNANDLAVDAQTQSNNVTVAETGGKSAKGTAFNASISLVDIDNITIATIDSSAVVGTTGNLRVEAEDDTLNVNLAGGFSKGVNAIGLGIAVNDITRTTRAGVLPPALPQLPWTTSTFSLDGAQIGADGKTITLAAGSTAVDGEAVVYSGNGISGLTDGTVYYVIVPDPAQPNVIQLALHPVSAAANVATGGLARNAGSGRTLTTTGAVNAIGTVTVQALNEGTIAAVAISGSFVDDGQAPPANGKSGSARLAQLAAFDKQAAGRYGISFSGDAAVNTIADTTEAGIVNARILDSASLEATASNSSLDLAVAGAVAVSTSKGKVPGIAGSYAENDVSNVTRAYLSNARAHVDQGLTLSADTDGSMIKAFAAGVAVSTKASGVAGSVSVNSVGNTTAAFIDGQSIVDAGSASIGAMDETSVFALAGTLDFAGEKGIGFGASFAINDIDNTTDAHVAQSDLTANLGGITLRQFSDQDVESVAVSAGASTGGLAANISISANMIDSTGTAYVSGKRTSGVLAATDVVIDSRDDSSILAIAGGLALSTKAAGVGAAGAYSQINNGISAYLDDTQVQAQTGSVVVNAATDELIRTVALGAGLGQSVGFAGSVAVNRIDTTTQAYLKGATVKADDSVAVMAHADYELDIYGGALGASAGVAGIGATIGVNLLYGDTYASITDASQVNAAGKGAVNVITMTGTTPGTRSATGVAVAARTTQNAETWGVSAGLGAQNGVALTGSGNEASGSTLAYIDGGSTINQDGTVTPHADQDVSVEAFSAQKFDTKLGGLGIGLSTAGFGATIGVGFVTTTTKAYIDNADVAAKRDLIVAAYSTEESDAVGITAAGGTGGALAGTIFVHKLASTNEAYIRNSDTIDAGHNLTVHAEDHVYLGRDDAAGILGGAAAVSGGASGGAAVSSVAISNSTRAYIADSQTDAYGTTTVEAVSSQEANSGVMGIVIGQYLGAGASVVVNSIATTTKAEVLESGPGTTKINAGTSNATDAQDVKVSATNTTEIETEILGATAGFVGIGASVDVTSVRNTVGATIGAGSEVNAAGDIDLKATSNREIDSTVIAFGGGAIGVQGAVSVVSVGAAANAGEISNTQTTVNSQNQEAHDRLGLSGNSNTFALDAMFSSTQEEGSTVASIAGGASVKAKQALNVTAMDKIEVDLLPGAGTAGALGLGASVGIATLKPVVRAYAGDGATLSAGTTLTVDATASIFDASVSANVVGIGGVAAVAAVAIVDSDATVDAHLGKSVDVLDADAVSVNATRLNKQKAEALGISIGGSGAIGASVARSISDGNTTAKVDDAADLAHAGALSVTASTRQIVPDATHPEIKEMSNYARAVAGAGGGLVGASGADALAESGGKVSATTGKGVILPTANVIIAAGSESTQRSESLGITVGGTLALGVTLAESKSSGDTEAILGADAQTQAGRTGDLMVAALAADTNTSKSEAGSGGVISGNGAEATTSDSGIVTASIAADTDGSPTLHAGAVTVQALNASTYGGEADSINAAVVGASGAIVKNNIGAGAVSSIGNGVHIVASDEIVASARDQFLSTVNGESANGGAGGVLSGSAVLSTTNITGRADVLLGQGVQLSSGTDVVLQPGAIVLEASSVVSVDDKVKLVTGGALVGGAAESKVNVQTSNNVDVGQGAILESDGSIAIGSFTSARATSTALANTWGVAGVGEARGDVVLTANEKVTVGDGARVTAFGNVNLTAGDDARGVFNGSLSGGSTAESYVRGLIAVPVSFASTDVTSNALLDIGDADIQAGRNVTLGAYNGTINSVASGEAHGYQLGFIPTDIGNSGDGAHTVTTAKIVHDGTVVAGMYHTLNIVIPENCESTANCAPTADAGEAPFTSHYDSQFDAQAFIDDHFTGPSATLLKSTTSDDAVGAVTLGTLFAAAGNVIVNARTIEGSGSIDAYGAPSITVDNQSKNYLILGNVLIPNAAGGRILYTGSAQAGALGGVTPTEHNPGAPGGITIRNSYDNALPGENFGPALFLTGDIENIGGGVDITNLQGSFGQTATIFGKTVNVSIPVGAAVIEIPDGVYYAGGNPYSEWNNAMFWPGGNPANGLLPDAKAAFNSLFGATYQGYGRQDQNNPNSFRIYFIGADCSGLDCTGTQFNPNVTYPTISQNLSAADLSGSRASSAIYGGQVIIKARYIDVNGGITIGPDTDWSVNLAASLMDPVLGSFLGQPVGGGEIARADWLYANNKVSSPIFELKTATASNGDSLIGVKYDAQNKRILLNDVRASADGGALVLEGAIMSTNGLGKIHVNGGLGDVEVNNQTGLNLQVQDIYTGNVRTDRPVTSIVDITDTNYAATGNHWVYSYTPEGLTKVYRGEQGSTIDEMDPVTTNTGFYQPHAGIRWAWQQVAYIANSLPAGSNTAVGQSLEQWGNRLGFGDQVSWVPTGDPNNPWRYVDVLGNYSASPVGHLDFSTPGLPAMQQTVGAQVVESYGLKLEGHSQNLIFGRPDPNFFYPKLVKVTSSTSVKADHAIAIEFSGSSTGRVAINANAGVSFAGNITNPGGATTINSGGAVTQSSGASIQTDSLVISATSGIGGSLQPMVARLSEDGAVEAVGGPQGVYLDLQGGRIGQVRSANGAGTQFGNVFVRSLDDLLPVAGGTGAIVGANITLESTLGSVGAATNPVRLSAMGADGSGGRVDVTAINDIHLLDTAQHNFLVGLIESEAAGDISIAVPNGAILSATGQTSAQALSNDQVSQIWNDLKLTASAGAEQAGSATATTVVNLKQTVDAQYAQYWELLRHGTVAGGSFVLDPASKNLFTAAAQAEGLTEQEFVSGRYNLLAESFKANLGNDWRSQQAFVTFDAHFAYQPTQQRINELTSNAVWTLEELRNSISGSALRSGSGGLVGNGAPNIIGHNVTLTARDGIGKLADPVEFTLEDVLQDRLSTGQRAAMALASTPGDILSLGKDAQGNIVTYQLGTLPGTNIPDFDSVPQGVTPYGFRIAQTSPLFVSATGALKVDSGGDAFIQSARETLMIDQVHAAGAVNLIAPGNIFAAHVRTDNGQPLVKSGGDMRLTAGTGSLGEEATPLTLQVGGRLTVASAADDAWLTSVGTLNFDRVFAGNRVLLVADGGSLLAGSGLAVEAHDASLEASIDIGSQDNAVLVRLAEGESLTATAGGNANVRGTGSTFQVSTLSAGGDVQLSADGDLQIGVVTSGGSATVTAAGSILSAAAFNGVNIAAEDITLSSDTSDIGAASKYLVIEDRGTTNAQAFGNVYLEQRNASLEAGLLAALNGSVNMTVTTGDATIGKIIALNDVNVHLTSNGALQIQDLDPATASLAVDGAGGSIEVQHAQVSRSLSASASSVNLGDISQVGGSGPLHLLLQGAGGGMADSIDASVTSANAVTIDHLSAQTAFIDADVANLWIENARVSSFGLFSNESFTASLDNVNKVRYDSDLQLYAPFQFYLRFYADPKFDTNALAIDYKDNFFVNGMSSGNSVTKFIPRMLSLIGLNPDKGAVDEEAPQSGLVTWSSSALIPEDAITAVEQLEVNGK